MDFTELIKAAAGNGAWGLLAIFLVKYFIEDKSKTIELLGNNHKETSTIMRNDKDKLMDVVISQTELLTQMKEILSQQTTLLNKNEENLSGMHVILEKIVDVQENQSNRLEKIEDKVERIEKIEDRVERIERHTGTK